MKRIILIAIFFPIFSSFMYLNAQWARTYGGIYDEGANSIQQTSDGGYIVAGYTFSFGAGGSDFWVLKLSSTGAIEWQRTYGGIDDESAYCIQQTSDGGYIVSGYTYSFGAGDSDFLVLKLSSTGGIEWQRTYGGSATDYPGGIIQQTKDGGYIVSGRTYSFGAGGYDFWVLKLSSTGGIEWQRTYGLSGSDHSNYIQQTSDGGYIVLGYTFSLGAGWSDLWVLKLSSTGGIEWQRTYGGSRNDYSRSIKQTSDGGYIVLGYTYSFGAGGEDLWVLKLSSTGSIEWQRTYGGSDDDWSGAIQQTKDGGYIVSGCTYSFGAGDEDYWILKLSSTGAIEWQRTYGGSNYDYLGAIIQQTKDGGYIVSGQTFSFGAGGGDYLILKLYSDGDIDSSCGFIGSSNASVLNTYISPSNSSVILGSPYISPSTSNCTVQNTNASVMLLCEAPKYTITISATTGGTTDPSPGSYAYYNKTEVQIKANPDTGYNFSQWTGDVPSGHEKDNPITITMNSNKSIKANFSAVPKKEEGGKKAGCFIATAAYGTPLHPHIDVLRNFRDKYLMPRKIGRSFVDFYYKYSPFVADLIAKNKVLKVSVRIILLPMIALSYSTVQFGPITTAVMLAFLFALPIFIILSYLRKIIKR